MAELQIVFLKINTLAPSGNDVSGNTTQTQRSPQSNLTEVDFVGGGGVVVFSTTGNRIWAMLKRARLKIEPIYCWYFEAELFSVVYPVVLLIFPPSKHSRQTTMTDHLIVVSAYHCGRMFLCQRSLVNTDISARPISHRSSNGFHFVVLPFFLLVF